MNARMPREYALVNFTWLVPVCFSLNYEIVFR